MTAAAGAPLTKLNTDVELPVSEVFGPTAQGEGPHTGQRVGFVRLGYCNLDCSWCDTPYTWDHTRFNVKAECPPRTVEWIRSKITAMRVTRMVLSGGEPMLWAKTRALRDLLGHGFPGIRWDAETNGTQIPPRWWTYTVDLSCVSPKLAHSGVPEARRIAPAAMNAWSELSHRRRDAVAFKFVARSLTDLDEIDRLVQRFDLVRADVWVMPEGRNPRAIVSSGRELADASIDRGFNISTRLHVLLWNDEKGR